MNTCTRICLTVAATQGKFALQLAKIAESLAVPEAPVAAVNTCAHIGSTVIATQEETNIATCEKAEPSAIKRLLWLQCHEHMCTLWPDSYCHLRGRQTQVTTFVRQSLLKGDRQPTHQQAVLRRVPRPYGSLAGKDGQGGERTTRGS